LRIIKIAFLCTGASILTGKSGTLHPIYQLNMQQPIAP